MPRLLKNIMCPTDFSDEAHRAIEYAEEFARANDGTLLLMHAIHVSAGDLKKDGHTVKFADAKQNIESRIAEERAKYAHGYAKCDIVVEVGDPGEVIVSTARQRKIDLIVISTHGESSIPHILVGTVAESIIRHAPCPVFVVRRGAD